MQSSRLLESNYLWRYTAIIWLKLSHIVWHLFEPSLLIFTLVMIIFAPVNEKSVSREIYELCGFSSHLLTHWGRVTHICLSMLTISGPDNGLSPGRRQAIIWTNAGILLIGPLGTNFGEILIEICTFSFKKMHSNMSSAKWRPFCLGLNVLSFSDPIQIAVESSSSSISRASKCYYRPLEYTAITSKHPCPIDHWGVAVVSQVTFQTHFTNWQLDHF